MNARKKLLFFATDSLLSKITLDSLLDGPYQIVGIVLAEHSAITGKVRESGLTLIDAKSIANAALLNKIPVFYSHENTSHQYKVILNKTKPDLIIVSCFQYKLPPLVCLYPRYGAYNIHPSCLPEYRGPVPLFWQFYYAETNTGITLHRLTDQMDQGDIVLQRKANFPDGCSVNDATTALATLTSEMVSTLATQLDQDTLTTIKQDETRASYHSWPDSDAFTIPVSWDVRRAYNFIKGTMNWKQAYTVVTSSGEISIKSVSSYSTHSNAEHTKASVSQTVIAFSDGYLFVD